MSEPMFFSIEGINNINGKHLCQLLEKSLPKDKVAQSRRIWENKDQGSRG